MLQNEKIKLFQKFLEYIQGNEDLTNEECDLIRLYGEEFDLWIDYIIDYTQYPLYILLKRYALPLAMEQLKNKLSST